MESSGLRGWIRLVESLWTRTTNVKNGAIWTQNRPKPSKKSKNPPKTLTPISLRLGLWYFNLLTINHMLCVFAMSLV